MKCSRAKEWSRTSLPTYLPQKPHQSDEYKQENRGTHLEWLPLLYETTTECISGLLHRSDPKEFLWQAEQLWMGKDDTVGPDRIREKRPHGPQLSPLYKWHNSTFRSICRQLLLRSARPAQPLPHLPSQKSSLLPDLSVPCVRVSSLCLLIHLSPPAHHGGRPLTHVSCPWWRVTIVHWCHPLGHLEGRTWMNLTHTTFLGHNYACPTLRRMKSQTYFPSALIRSGRTLLGPHRDPDGSASQESLPPSLHPWLVCALISLEYVLFWVNFTWCLGSF